MQELSSAQKSLRSYKNDLSDVRGRIAARKTGPFGWVVTMYGEG